jgi:hypothetical protein
MLIEHCIRWLPEELKENTLYLAYYVNAHPDDENYSADQVETYPYILAFLCPCGCGERIHVPIDMDPERVRDCDSWQIVSLDPFTIMPSIQRRVGCRSHMFIRNNNIDLLP